MEYIKKNDKTKILARNDFEKKLLPKVRKYLRQDFGKNKWTFESFLVGSAKRNLILIGNEGFDLDYQLHFNKMPNEYKNDAKKTKDLFRDYFNKAIKELNLDLHDCEDSTHVLTIKKIENGKIIYSYDVAILRFNINNQYIILKNEKSGSPLKDYHYVELENCDDFDAGYSKIRNSKDWGSLRKIYKDKKEQWQSTNKENRHHSFSLLGQAVNEVIQKNGLG